MHDKCPLHRASVTMRFLDIGVGGTGGSRYQSGVRARPLSRWQLVQSRKRANRLGGTVKIAIYWEIRGGGLGIYQGYGGVGAEDGRG